MTGGKQTVLGILQWLAYDCVSFSHCTDVKVGRDIPYRRKVIYYKPMEHTFHSIYLPDWALTHI
jgi:hypothetical protein